VAVYAYINQQRSTAYVSDDDLNWLGTWASGTTYYPPVDAVTANGGMWIAIQTNANVSPTAIMRYPVWSQLVFYKNVNVPPDLAQQAYDLAVTGTNLANEAVDTANAAFYLAESGTALAQTAYNIATLGTDYALAEAAYFLAALGTDLGTNTFNVAVGAAYVAQETAWSGTSGADSAISIANQGTSYAGTNMAYTALQTAWSGTSGANSAFSIAVAGSNLAYTALTTAWSGTRLGNEALGIAVTGTNLAYTALTTAWAGTSAGTAYSNYIITTNTTYYISTTGSDSNSGTSAGAAWATYAHAAAVISQLTIATGVTVTIQFADGTYTQGLTGINFQGGGNVVVQGNTGNQNAVVINPSTGNPLLLSGQYSNITFTYLSLSGGNSGFIIQTSIAKATLGNLTIGSCSTYSVLINVSSSISWQNSTIQVTGGAVTFMYVASGSVCNWSSNTINFTGSSSFSSYVFNIANLSLLICPSLTILNGSSCSGNRYFVSGNAVINGTGGVAAYLPGNQNGTTSTGGIYG
jgi:hypothetical protein